MTTNRLKDKSHASPRQWVGLAYGQCLSMTSVLCAPRAGTLNLAGFEIDAHGPPSG